MRTFLDIDQTEWIAQNDLAFAIRDRYPVSAGHALVITRRPVSEWWDATTQEQQALLALVDIVKRRTDVEFSPDGYNVGFNAGEAAGQTVPHLHVHVIPRYDGDVPDPRGGIRHVIPERGNHLGSLQVPPPSRPSLITPFDGVLRLELIRSLIRPDLDRIDLLVSFVMRSGVQIVADHLDEALERGAHIRLLTTDYLQVTDAAALGFFLDRLESSASGRLEARVFSDPTTSFHPKAYIFSSSINGAGVAFVGSSNLSRSGLTTGVEWNIETRSIEPLLTEFDRLWADVRAIPLTGAWLQSYSELRQAKLDGMATTHVRGTDEAVIEQAEFAESEAAPEPWSVQAEALSALEATRIDGHQAGLVVMATGLGKTWLAAFDSTRPEFRRVLFVAHREEILKQARDVYRQIRPGGALTLFTGTERDPGGDVVFASVQSLHGNLDVFDQADFDYVVVDEFHHAAAETYRRVLAHFQPRFLLGLTATPERGDAADLMALCSDNLVYDCGLTEGINRRLLSPFRYRAIVDTTDYEHIPWRSGRFDSEELTAHIATQQRAAQVYDEWLLLDGSRRRALGFCSTVAHADFMADFFRTQGVAAVAVHSGPTSAPRAESLERLEAGKLAVIFTVDLFNEGVDLPSIDVVLMLRPTESAVVFLQQLGRGLRRSASKAGLDVLDLVGNHKSFLLKARLLAQLAGYRNRTNRESVDILSRLDEDETTALELPDGCSIIVEPEVIDLLRSLLGRGTDTDRIVELIREWVDEHEGRRPRAMEIGLLSPALFKLKSVGGWFGLLDRLELLSDPEREVARLASEFFSDIEHGAYTKSFKLITLLALLQLDGLRSGARVADIANTSRWMIFRDSELLADLSDATAAFADPRNPSPAEWERYWLKNPINAWTSSGKRDQAPFTMTDGVLVLNLDIPAHLGSNFDGMVRELVEYRLHRYLAAQTARRVGERRKPVVDDKTMDATFVVESTGGVATSVVIESAGGTAGTESARNIEYVAGVDVVLRRLGELGASLVDAYVDSSTTTALTVADRRLDLGDATGYPISLADVGDLTAIRRALLRSMAKVGQAPGATGGGNSRKRMRLIVDLPQDMTDALLADALAEEHSPVGRSLASPAPN